MGVNFKNPETFARTIGFSAKSVATFKSIAAWAAAAATVYGAVAVAIDIITKVLGDHDPVEEALEHLKREVANLRDKLLAGQLAEKLEDAALAHGAMIGMAATLRDFVAQRGAQERATLIGGLKALEDQIIGRSLKNANLLPFDPLAYAMLSGEATPAWMMMHGSWPVFTGFTVPLWLQQNAPGPLPNEEQSATESSLFFGGPLNRGFVQVLRPVAAGPHSWGESPASLKLNALRWDGRFNFPLLVFGSMLYENALRGIEPYYRTTGHRHERLGEIVGALERFASDWDAQLLWSAEMPAAPPPQNHAMSLLFGFQHWSCGAVDPVFGTASFQEGWWTPKFPPDWGFGAGPEVGLMSLGQNNELTSARSTSLNWVRQQNGLQNLRNTASAMRALLVPPWASDSLTVFPDRGASIKVAVLQSTPATAKTFNIITPPTTFNGTHEARHVRVRVPIAIQGNPGLEGIANLRRLAASDVTFGYRIELVGENQQRSTVFEAPLRRRVGQEGIWHTQATGPQALRAVPRTIGPVALAYGTRTYLRYADPTGALYRQDDFKSETVSMTCQVIVSDPDHNPISGVEGEWPPRGVLWLEIESNDVTNRSFELHLEVTETTAVGADGLPTENDNALVVYRSPAVVPVDALVGIFPTEYHTKYEQERQAFWDWLERINDEYTRVRPLGPPRPDDPLDRFRGVLDLVEDPFWSAAVVAHFDRTRQVRDTPARDAILSGVAQFQQSARPVGITPSAGLRVQSVAVGGRF